MGYHNHLFCFSEQHANMILICSDNKRLADAVLEKEKDKEIAQVFDKGFSWSEAFDALADIYCGVSCRHSSSLRHD